MLRTIKTREEWLNAFTKKARPVFKRAGYTIPPNVRVSVGWTSKGSRSKRIGECWAEDSLDDGTFEIFISPRLPDASRMADIHTHELIHAAVGLDAQHKKPFVDCMKALGLEGKPTETVAGAAWHEWADPIVESLGPMPHATLNPGAKTTTQTTRMIKCECTGCGFTFRTTLKWLEAAEDNLSCPNRLCVGALNIG